MGQVDSADIAVERWNFTLLGKIRTGLKPIWQSRPVLQYIYIYIYIDRYRYRNRSHIAASLPQSLIVIKQLVLLDIDIDI